MTLASAKNWQESIGYQRDWSWRGWQIRYSYQRCISSEATKPPLILIHGFGACIEHWRKNIPFLSQQSTVYAIDLLGFGASRKVATLYNADLWVEQIYDFWRTFINQPVVLVGNSIGSLICLTAANKYPEMVQGLVMLSLPDVSLKQELIPQWLKPIVTTLENLVASPIIIKPLFQILRQRAIIRKWAKIAYVNPDAVTEELVDILATPPQDEASARAFCALCQSANLTNFAPPVKKILPNLNIPILLIWGRLDAMIPFSLAGQFAALNTKIHLVALDNIGHCPHDEDPDQFNAIVLNWLDLHFEKNL